MTAENTPIGSLAEAMSRLSQLKGGGWIFRGQTEDYKLIPKIGREQTRGHENQDNRIPYSFDYEKYIFDIFKAKARMHFNIRAENDLEVLAVAQHHGMPTRLLDWTESFLIALHFALKSAGIKGGEPRNPVVYAFCKPCEVTGDDAKSPFCITKIKSYTPPNCNSENCDTTVNIHYSSRTNKADH